ncbi:MAG: tRNA (guanosine(46)-N7)-methyltransferase TrmB [Proteobacteria bacterium]|nr:tRNA (guanosine(46)-N7)-methyltransferase TrmB [Pseudomonadota bacterium]
MSVPFSPIRSFVRRDSRFTRAQKEAIENDWNRYVLPRCDGRAALVESFGRKSPVTLEIGSGDGTCVLELAVQRPDENFVAVEVHRPGLGRLLNRAKSGRLSNIRVSDQDIFELIDPAIEPLFEKIMIFFPDPWPKRRHHKRRMLQARFFDLMESRLHRHGRMFVATDSRSYADSILKTMESLPRWVNLAGAGQFAPRAAFRPITRFESRALAAGATVFDFCFARR